MYNEDRCMTEYVKKQKMVVAVQEMIFRGLLPGVTNAEYEVWRHKDDPAHYYEFIKVSFPGGAYCVRNNTGNSIREVFRSIANLIYGGYYTEVRFYDSICEDKDWERVDLSFID